METPPRPAWASAYGSHTRPVPEGRLKEHLVSKCIVLMTLLRTGVLLQAVLVVSVVLLSQCRVGKSLQAVRTSVLCCRVFGWRISPPTPPQCWGLTEVQPRSARLDSTVPRFDQMCNQFPGRVKPPSGRWGLQGGGSVHVEWNARGLLQAGSEVCPDRLHELGCDVGELQP